MKNIKKIISQRITGWKGKYMVQKHFLFNNDNKSLTSSVWWESTLKFSDKLQKGPTEASCVAANFQGILLITTFDLSQLFFWLLPRDRLQKKKRNHRSRSVPGNSKAILGRRNRRLEILGQEILGSAPPPAEISQQCKILDSYPFFQFSLSVFQALSEKYIGT